MNPTRITLLSSSRKRSSARLHFHVAALRGGDTVLDERQHALVVDACAEADAEIVPAVGISLITTG
jgi:hypothetical protein